MVLFVFDVYSDRIMIGRESLLMNDDTLLSGCDIRFSLLAWLYLNPIRIGHEFIVQILS